MYYYSSNLLHTQTRCVSPTAQLKTHIQGSLTISSSLVVRSSGNVSQSAQPCFSAHRSSINLNYTPFAALPSNCCAFLAPISEVYLELDRMTVEPVVARTSCQNEEKSSNLLIKKERQKNKRKKSLMKESEKADKRGVCYLSRIPPHMNPLMLRQILSEYGEIQRIYLTPEDPAAQVRRKKSGGFRGQEFSEGWVEFTEKSIAKRVAKMLNGEQIGGRKRSSFYYDLWNIKYLSKFKWDDLTDEIAIKNATREQKLALELSAAKRERDFYLSKVDQSIALSQIKERLEKKQKVEMVPKVIRKFPQKKPVVNETGETNELSREVLAGVFGGS